MLAPVLIFGYNRPQLFARMAASLKANVNFENHKVFAFIDGPKTAADSNLVSETILEARKLTDNVTVADKNQGLAASIINGVTEIINTFGRAIVIEDDLILHPLFLNFMDFYLDNFEKDSNILSICGFGLKIKRPSDYKSDIYLARRASSWGWGTWADRWNKIDWNVTRFAEIKDSRKLQKEFNRGGSDMCSMLNDYMTGRNNSWAIRFCFHQFLNGYYSVHPFKSLVINDGYNQDATNCRQKYNRFKTDFLNEKETPALCTLPELQPEPLIDSQLRKYHSVSRRIYSKIRRILNI